MAAKKIKKVPAFSPKQLEILSFPYQNEGEYDAVIADGAIRSGKTIAEALAFLLWSMSEFNGANFIIASKSVGAANRNIIRPLQQIKYIREHFDIKYSISKGYMTVERGKKINYYYVFGGMNERSQDVVQGGTMSGAFIDEAALMPRSFVEQCVARCSVENALIWFNCNPLNPAHWFKQEWIDKVKEKHVKYLHFTMDDNPSLTDRVKQRYINQNTGVFYKRNILGLWVAAEGVIYEDFANNPEQYIIDEVPSTWKLDYIDVGIDFGGTKSTTSFVLKGVYNGMRDLVILRDDELVGDYTTDELGLKYQEFEKKVQDEFGYYFNTYCDNAEPVLIRSLKNYARMSAIKKAAKTSIFGRIKFTTTMIKTHHFWIRGKYAPHVVKSLTEAVWDDKHADTRLDNGTFNVDALDAMEYSFERDIKKLMFMNSQIQSHQS